MIIIVKAFHFRFGSGTQTNKLIQHKHNDKCTDSGIGDSHHHCEALNTQLLHYTPFGIFTDRISHPAVADKKGQEDRTDNTTDSMDSKSVKRIVKAEFIFKLNRDITETSCED